MPPEIPKVRTFEQDVAESMRTKQASILHVALAEQEKVAGVLRETRKERNYFWVYLLSGCLLIGGLSFLGYTFFVSQKNITPLPIQSLSGTADSFISDETLSVAVNLSQRSAALALLSATSSIDDTLGTVTRVVPFVTETNASGEAQARAITSQEFFGLFGNAVPDIFRRSLGRDFTFVRVVDEGMHAGIVVPTTDYERTVVGLTAWERTMVEDLEELFGYSRRIEVKELVEVVEDVEVIEEKEVIDPKTKKVRLVTSTSTEQISRFEERVTYINDTISFTNDVRKNVELRIAKGTSGAEYLVYGFPKRDTLIIAGSVNGFLRIIDRLAVE